MQKAREIFDELREYLSENELSFHNAFDVFLYIRALAQKLDVKMPSYFA